jgi:hypothetical protein
VQAITRIAEALRPYTEARQAVASVLRSLDAAGTLIEAETMSFPAMND